MCLCDVDKVTRMEDVDHEQRHGRDLDDAPKEGGVVLAAGEEHHRRDDRERQVVRHHQARVERSEEECRGEVPEEHHA